MLHVKLHFNSGLKPNFGRWDIRKSWPAGIRVEEVLRRPGCAEGKRQGVLKENARVYRSKWVGYVLRKGQGYVLRKHQDVIKTRVCYLKTQF